MLAKYLLPIEIQSILWYNRRRERIELTLRLIPKADICYNTHWKANKIGYCHLRCAKLCRIAWFEVDS